MSPTSSCLALVPYFPAASSSLGIPSGRLCFLLISWLAAPSQIFWLVKVSFPKLGTSAAKFSLSRHVEIWLLLQALTKLWPSRAICYARAFLWKYSGKGLYLRCLWERAPGSCWVPAGSGSWQTREPPPLMLAGNHWWGDQFKTPLESNPQRELEIFRQNVVPVGAWEPWSQLKMGEVLACRTGPEFLLPPWVDKGF